MPDCVTLLEITPGYPVIEIDHPACRARVALLGATVMSWRPMGGEEVLYLSPDAVFKEGKAIRGGIPICWPWFNAHPTDPGLPSHGLARTRFWKLDEVLENEAGVIVRLSLSEGIWSAVATIGLGSVLELCLESLNPGTVPIKISGALHSYFRIGDICSIKITGLEDTDYLDTVGVRTRCYQTEEIRFSAETDSIYDSSSSLRIVDGSIGRTISIAKTGSPSTVVWNPWAEKAKALSDMPDEGYREFVCVETAISNDRAVTVLPGESYLLATRISVE